MSELLRSGKVGNIQINQLAEQRELVVSRWEKTGMLEGLNGYKRDNIAQLLENQAGSLLKEAANDTGNIAGFDIVVFPMVRRVFSRLLANDIVSVQPLNLPTGLLFYLDAQVETGTTGDRGGYASVYDAHYNTGGHAFSFGTGLTTYGSAGTSSYSAVASSSTASVTLYYAGGEESLASLRINGTGSTTAIPFAIDPQTWTQGLFKNNQIMVRHAPPTDGFAGKVHAVWEVYEDLEAKSNMAEVKLLVTSTTVQVTSRKMKGRIRCSATSCAAGVTSYRLSRY